MKNTMLRKSFKMLEKNCRLNTRHPLLDFDDPLRYRILDQQAHTDPDICVLYHSRPYPVDARIPWSEITRILNAMQVLGKVNMTIYLRTASINIYNGMLSLTFSCDGSHYMHYDEFLAEGTSFWSGEDL